MQNDRYFRHSAHFTHISTKYPSWNDYHESNKSSNNMISSQNNIYSSQINDPTNISCGNIQSACGNNEMNEGEDLLNETESTQLYVRIPNWNKQDFCEKSLENTQCNSQLSPLSIGSGHHIFLNDTNPDNNVFDSLHQSINSRQMLSGNSSINSKNPLTTTSLPNPILDNDGFETTNQSNIYPNSVVIHSNKNDDEITEENHENVFHQNQSINYEKKIFRPECHSTEYRSQAAFTFNENDRQRHVMKSAKGNQMVKKLELNLRQEFDKINESYLRHRRKANNYLAPLRLITSSAPNEQTKRIVEPISAPVVGNYLRHCSSDYFSFSPRPGNHHPDEVDRSKLTNLNTNFVEQSRLTQSPMSCKIATSPSFVTSHRRMVIPNINDDQVTNNQFIQFSSKPESFSSLRMNNNNNNDSNKTSTNSSPSSEEVYICKICSGRFNSKGSLSKHQSSHSDNRKFQCEQCKKCFKRQDHLTGHRNVHKQTKPHGCIYNDCSKSYSDARSLLRHIFKNHQDKLKKSVMEEELKRNDCSINGQIYFSCSTENAIKLITTTAIEFMIKLKEENNLMVLLMQLNSNDPSKCLGSIVELLMKMFDFALSEKDLIELKNDALLNNIIYQYYHANTNQLRYDIRRHLLKSLEYDEKNEDISLILYGNINHKEIENFWIYKKYCSGILLKLIDEFIPEKGKYIKFQEHKSVKCDTCGLRFKNNSALNGHKRVHSLTKRRNANIPALNIKNDSDEKPFILTPILPKFPKKEVINPVFTKPNVSPKYLNDEEMLSRIVALLGEQAINSQTIGNNPQLSNILCHQMMKESKTNSFVNDTYVASNSRFPIHNEIFLFNQQTESRQMSKEIKIENDIQVNPVQNENGMFTNFLLTNGDGKLQQLQQQPQKQQQQHHNQQNNSMQIKEEDRYNVNFPEELVKLQYETNREVVGDVSQKLKEEEFSFERSTNKRSMVNTNDETTTKRIKMENSTGQETILTTEANENEQIKCIMNSMPPSVLNSLLSLAELVQTLLKPKTPVEKKQKFAEFIATRPTLANRYTSQLRSPFLKSNTKVGTNNNVFTFSKQDTTQYQSVRQYYTPAPMINPMIHQVRNILENGGKLNNFTSSTLNKSPIYTDTIPHINIGENCQATIPSFEEHAQLDIDRQDDLLYSYETLSANPRSLGCFDSYIELATKAGFSKHIPVDSDSTSSTEQSSLDNIDINNRESLRYCYVEEQVLHILHVYNYNISRALSTLINGKIDLPSNSILRSYNYAHTTYWSEEEHLKFQEAFLNYHKKFDQIAEFVGTKDICQCIEYYYQVKYHIQYGKDTINIPFTSNLHLAVNVE
ncbi:hypothetical protein SNEBB_001739 [Seison nebaliae]|nr:hypothetical protein SNEBB_001739 [Seison nebaliae]